MADIHDPLRVEQEGRYITDYPTEEERKMG